MAEGDMTRDWWEKDWGDMQSDAVEVRVLDGVGGAGEGRGARVGLHVAAMSCWGGEAGDGEGGCDVKRVKK